MSERKRSRRGQGEGSVYEQRPGLWAACVDLGWIEGKRRRKYVYAKTEAEVIRKRDDLKRQQGLGVNLAANAGDADPIEVRLWSWGREFQITGTAEAFGEYLYETVAGTP